VADIVNGQQKIRIICTCRAPENIEPRRVGFIDEVMARQPVGKGCSMMRNRDGIGTGYRLRCGRCPRAPVFTFDRWAQLVEELDADGADTLDISERRF
jgi:hypothetical protein